MRWTAHLEPSCILFGILPAMNLDSEVTLTGAGVAERVSAILIFDKDSMRNATLRLSGHEEALYTLRSGKDFRHTELFDARDGASVAKIVKHNLLPDQIMLRGRPTMSIRSWLHSRREYWVLLAVCCSKSRTLTDGVTL
jgi:hypothetical protein